ncbi:CGNR zinc finger domain-containing protein [Streptomyces sp. NPDC088354]|uniref:CGNR zinc finger domain-containing protein n=1 Tax=unclassified Streptomyces TaxID=2593676 RepID=UPI0029ADB225|nr:CGNR zinc finger domain-containing protein [Streptomyces sp. MI02-7b]MDX3072568.1 CGNR zinc finger domain-containing protein [Streptomyces sp. MI02-7b]
MSTPVLWPASARYEDAESSAPGGLGFVQDLLNTASLGKPRQADLLESPESARQWLESSFDVLRRVDPGAPAAPHDLDPEGLRRVLSLRDDLRTVLSSGPAGEPSEAVAVPSIETTAAVGLGAEGARLRPHGDGVEAVRSYVLIQLVAASYGGTLRRLKVCANPRCRGAFYDRSKNCSRVWHNVSTCGNSQNVRAYRARLKERGLSSAQ